MRPCCWRKRARNINHRCWCTGTILVRQHDTILLILATVWHLWTQLANISPSVFQVTFPEVAYQLRNVLKLVPEPNFSSATGGHFHMIIIKNGVPTTHLITLPVEFRSSPSLRSPARYLRRLGKALVVTSAKWWTVMYPVSLPESGSQEGNTQQWRIKAQHFGHVLCRRTQIYFDVILIRTWRLLPSSWQVLLLIRFGIR